LIQRNWDMTPKGSEVDVANSAFGGKIIHASNEHYGPAAQIISPFPAIHMFDGFESARSREKDHFEEITLELRKPSRVHRIQFDFTFFKNNNPRELAVHGLEQDGKQTQWLSLVDRTNVKAYAGNLAEFAVQQPYEFRRLKITLFPDGGINRLRVFTIR
jgi:allantoicase